MKNEMPETIWAGFNVSYQPRWQAVEPPDPDSELSKEIYTKYVRADTRPAPTDAQRKALELFDNGFDGHPMRYDGTGEDGDYPDMSVCNYALKSQDVETIRSALAAPSENRGMVSLKDRLPPFDENLRVIIYTEGHDFGGEQYFDVKALDLYPAPHPENQRYGEYSTEVAEAATHWFYRPNEAPSEKTITPFDWDRDLKIIALVLKKEGDESLLKRVDRIRALLSAPVVDGGEALDVDAFLLKHINEASAQHECGPTDKVTNASKTTLLWGARRAIASLTAPRPDDGGDE